MKHQHKLADLQLAIMQVLWDKGDATVAQVRAALQPTRDLAHTTIGTMLTKLEDKGIVSHRNDGRANIYHAEIEKENVDRTMVADLTERLFSGDISQMVCQLLADDAVTKDDLSRLKKLIRDKEKELKNE